ncbi:MAG: FAD:protein FMN transferase [Planctomycetaceae bacterium]|nr:FAD:protein FMN transferase [Planctomycetaceae bacterium]
MGTTYAIKLTEVPAGETGKGLKRAVDDALERINAQMSTYRSDSELSRFNASDSTEWFPVSAATATVVAEAQRVSRESGGAFDATVMPLVNLWSFGPEARPDAVPSDADLAERRAHVGHEKLEVRLDPPALKKSDPRVSVDLSAIAKGYGVDVVAELLDERGVTAYMVEIGGEVRTKGPKNDDGALWQIGIERPVAGKRAVEKIVALDDDSMATSGDYRNYFEAGGKRYSHTLDPRSGRPIEHTLVSASVLAPTCMTADAYATTVMVLGPAEGYDWLVERDIAALLIVKVGERFVEKPTPAFSAKIESRHAVSGEES